jgi:hypothetical protein
MSEDNNDEFKEFITNVVDNYVLLLCDVAKDKGLDPYAYTAGFLSKILINIIVENQLGPECLMTDQLAPQTSH